MVPGIKLSNGRVLRYVLASGSMAYGLGWLHEWLLIAMGYIDLNLFTTVTKTLTWHPRKGDFRWWKPWACIKLIPGGCVNKVSLTNPGIKWWCKKVASKINFFDRGIVVSVASDSDDPAVMKEELVEAAKILNYFDLVAIEVNVSCPNTGHELPSAKTVIECIKAVREVSRHPTIVKVSISQSYMEISRGLEGFAEAITLNSVPWEIYARVHARGQRSPLWKLEDKVGGGGGGVSGGPAQALNWAAVHELTEKGSIPVIAPSIMKAKDIQTVTDFFHASAVSFGAIHLPGHPTWLRPLTFFLNPLKPTKIVRKEMIGINDGHVF